MRVIFWLISVPYQWTSIYLKWTNSQNTILLNNSTGYQATLFWIRCLHAFIYFQWKKLLSARERKREFLLQTMNIFHWGAKEKEVCWDLLRTISRSPWMCVSQFISFFHMHPGPRCFCHMVFSGSLSLRRLYFSSLTQAHNH